MKKDLAAETTPFPWVMSLPLRWFLMALGLFLLSLAFEPFGWDYLAWLALVPWTLAILAPHRPGLTFLGVWLLGLAFYLANLYWLAPVTPAGYATLCFYLAWHFVLSGLIIRTLWYRHAWPLTWVLPVVWVAQEYLRALLLTGFPWFFLAHTQHRHLALIQVSDLVGAYGVSFLVAWVNGFLCDLLLRWRPRRQSARVWLTFLMWRLVPTVLLLGGSLGYGRYRLSQPLQPGPILTVIQDAIPQYVKEYAAADRTIFTRHENLTRQALAATVKPDLVVWPETMVPAPLNTEFLNLRVSGYDLQTFKPWVRARYFDRRLRNLTRLGPAPLDLTRLDPALPGSPRAATDSAPSGVALLVGAPSVEMAVYDGELRPARRANSALLYLPGGRRFPERYDKMHLVPFGEVVPFKKSWPWLYRLLNRLTPYDYEYSLDAGENPTVFRFPDRRGRRWRFAVAICYEDVMPQVPRRLAVAGGAKRIDFLLNISNDGWFVSGKLDADIKPTSELIQHLVICRFRAVENRLGIARAVNTGVSAFIQPDGRLQGPGLAGTLDPDPGRRPGRVGFLTDRIYLDERVTLYSRIGDVFAFVCTLLALTMLGVGIFPKARLRIGG